MPTVCACIANPVERGIWSWFNLSPELRRAHRKRLPKKNLRISVHQHKLYTSPSCLVRIPAGAKTGFGDQVIPEFIDNLKSSNKIGSAGSIFTDTGHLTDLNMGCNKNEGGQGYRHMYLQEMLFTNNQSQFSIKHSNFY